MSDQAVFQLEARVARELSSDGEDLPTGPTSPFVVLHRFSNVHDVLEPARARAGALDLLRVSFEAEYDSAFVNFMTEKFNFAPDEAADLLLEWRIYRAEH